MLSIIPWRELRPVRIEWRGNDSEIWRDFDREYSVDMALWPMSGRTDGAAAAMTPNVASNLKLNQYLMIKKNLAFITYTAHLKRSTRSPGRIVSVCWS
jgi:hypothetical protein